VQSWCKGQWVDRAFLARGVCMLCRGAHRRLLMVVVACGMKLMQAELFSAAVRA
jgi:hypothetical protein